MRVAIVGAGIGGLCSAIGLRNAGAEVTLLEQADEVRAAGSGISVFGNGLRALDAIGMGTAFREISSPDAASFRGGQRRPDGSWLATVPMDAVSELRVVDRASLHDMLRSAIPDEVVRTSARVSSVDEAGGVSWTDRAGAAHRADFDLVVGADGIGSRIRRSFPDNPGIAYAGYAAWRGITDAPVELNEEAGETWGVRQRFGLAPLRDGRVYWFGVVSVERERRFVDDRAALVELFGAWHDPIPEIIEATSPHGISYLPIDELAGRLRSFTRGRTVLVGDAAHAMTPNLGQGGGQAMEDAATLSSLLSPIAAAPEVSDTAILTALARYDNLRVRRTQTISRRSRLIGLLAHAPGERLREPRDLILRATPVAALRRQLAWLQDWAPPPAQ